MDECRALAAWADALPIVRPTPASQEQIEKHLRFLSARLPTQGHDDDTGRMRVAVDISMLSGWSNDALAFMCRTALERLKWFPVPADMLAILREYRPPESERGAMLRLCAKFAEEAFDTWLANVRSGQPIGDVPDQWKRIAECQGILRRMDDGSFVIRQQYQGPLIPIAQFQVRA